MNFDEMEQAVGDAENTLRRMNRHIDAMAHMITGRLKSAEVSSYVLSQLKKELRHFNIHTKQWK